MQNSNLRIGDAERTRAVDALGDHFAAGRLDRTELDERSALALRARTADELRELLRDLPEAPAARSAARDDTGSGVAARARTLWLATGLAPWAIMSVAFVVIWFLTGAQYFWPVWPISGWGVGVATTGVLAYRLPAEYLRRRARQRPDLARLARG